VGDEDRHASVNVSVPRPASVLPAPRVLIALLGDYWFHTIEPIPSAALVALLREFGVGDAGARAALSRLARQGTIEGTKRGRRTAYRLTRAAVDVAVSRGRALMGFGIGTRSWDGEWTCVAFSFPDERARLRPALRAGLRRLGMAPLYDGLWVSPHDLSEAASVVLADVGARASTVFRARIPRPAGGRHPVEAWDLDELRRRYLAFIADVEPVAVRLRAGTIGEAESLVIRTEVTAAWRRLVYGDPALPTELLPVPWPLPAARAIFVEVYDGLGPLAEARARAVVAPYRLTEVALPRHHTVGDLL
jgi:phenylacetic acid degradation operon negative regulatory protein